MPWGKTRARVLAHGTRTDELLEVVMAVNVEQPLLQAPDRVLSTMEKDGSRRWLNPRLSKGRFWQARRAVAYLLIALFTLIPYVNVRGKPAVWLDVIHRRFTILGVTFLPTDTIL